MTNKRVFKLAPLKHSWQFISIDTKNLHCHVYHEKDDKEKLMIIYSSHRKKLLILSMQERLFHKTGLGDTSIIFTSAINNKWLNILKCMLWKMQPGILLRHLISYKAYADTYSRLERILSTLTSLCKFYRILNILTHGEFTDIHIFL